MERLDANISFAVNANMHLTDYKKRVEVGKELRKIYTDGLFQDNLGAAVKVNVILYY